MSCGGCCSNPHGRSTPWLQLFAIIAWCLAINAAYGCFYITVSANNSLWKFTNATNSDAFGFGFFTYADPRLDEFSGYTCIEWGSNSFSKIDGAWRAARAFAIVGNICTGIGALTSIIMSCKSFSKYTMNVLVGLLLLGSLSEVMTFTIFASNVCKEGCLFGTGAGLAIGASIFAFITALFMHNLPPSRYDEFISNSPYGVGMPSSGVPGTVTVETSIEPDGTKTTTTTTTNGDGSKTVQQTVERPMAVASPY